MQQTWDQVTVGALRLLGLSFPFVLRPPKNFDPSAHLGPSCPPAPFHPHPRLKTREYDKRQEGQSPLVAIGVPSGIKQNQGGQESQSSHGGKKLTKKLKYSVNYLLTAAGKGHLNSEGSGAVSKTG